MGNCGPHPAATARTSEEARRGRTALDWALLENPEQVARGTASLLAGDDHAARDEAMRGGFARIYEAYNRRDWEINTLFLDSDEYLFRPGDFGQAVPDARDEYHGIEAYIDAMETFIEGWVDLRVDLERLIFTEDGRVVSTLRWGGAGRRSGIPLDQTGVGEHIFRDGVVVTQSYWWSVTDLDRVLHKRPGAARR